MGGCHPTPSTLIPSLLPQVPETRPHLPHPAGRGGFPGRAGGQRGHGTPSGSWAVGGLWLSSAQTLCCEFACVSGCAGWLCRAQPWPDATCMPGCAGWLGRARLGRRWVFLEQQNTLCAGQVGRKSFPWEGAGQGMAAACTVSSPTSSAGPVAPHHGAVGSAHHPALGSLHGGVLAQ